MKKQKIVACGKLTYSDIAQYELRSRDRVFNISEILDKVYHSDKNYIEIEILDGYKSIYNEQGCLVMKQDSDGIYGYHINGACLESVLFFNTNKNLGIEILADALVQGVTAYDNKQSTK